MVFKSVVRVLEGKTRHYWLHTDAQDADLVLVGDQVRAACGAMDGMEAAGKRAVIHVSAAPCQGFDGLGLPLRIADVISQMDRAGEQIASRQSAAATPARRAAVVPPVEAPVATVLQMAAYRENVVSDERISLTRWPEATLLQRDFRYLKLATLLTGQPVSIAELAERTQFPMTFCQGFVDSLRSRQLLRVMESLQAAPILKPVVTAAPVLRPVQHHGLIARIRSRLELIVGTSAAR